MRVSESFLRRCSVIYTHTYIQIYEHLLIAYNINILTYACCSQGYRARVSESFRKAETAVMVLSYIYTCTYIHIDVSTFSSSSSSQGYRTRVSESFRKAQSAVLSYMHTYTHIHMYVSTFPLFFFLFFCRATGRVCLSRSARPSYMHICIYIYKNQHFLCFHRPTGLVCPSHSARPSPL